LKRCEPTGKGELVLSIGPLEGVEKLSSKHATEDLHGQEELASAGNPAAVILRETCAYQ
jgi:hypothetical protein